MKEFLSQLEYELINQINQQETGLLDLVKTMVITKEAAGRRNGERDLLLGVTSPELWLWECDKLYTSRGVKLNP